jgi:hypothetical protein
MAKGTEVHRHRLGVAEQERRVGQQQHARQNQGAERIDVLERVEGDPAALPGGVVAERVRDKTMRRLVEGDGDDQRHDPDREVVKGDVQSGILTGSAGGPGYHVLMNASDRQGRHLRTARQTAARDR